MEQFEDSDILELALEMLRVTKDDLVEILNDETYAKLPDETARRLLDGIRRELSENERDLQRATERYNELTVRRRKLWNGYYGIKGLTEKGAD